MSSRNGIRERWIAEVLRADYIGDACRVLLLVLARNMTDRGAVSVPRHKLATMLGKPERRISERIAEAVKAGLLSRLGGGYRGRTAEYMAYLPGRKGAGRQHSLSGKDAGTGVPETAPFSQPVGGGKGAAQQVPNARARGRVPLRTAPRTRLHDGSHASPGHPENQERSEGAVTGHLVAAATSRPNDSVRHEQSTPLCLACQRAFVFSGQASCHAGSPIHPTCR